MLGGSVCAVSRLPGESPFGDYLFQCSMLYHSEMNGTSSLFHLALKECFGRYLASDLMYHTVICGGIACECLHPFNHSPLFIPLSPKSP